MQQQVLFRVALSAVFVCSASMAGAQSQPRRQTIQEFPLTVKKSSGSDTPGQANQGSESEALRQNVAKLTAALRKSEKENRALRTMVVEARKENLADSSSSDKKLRERLDETKDVLEQEQRTNRKLEAAFGKQEKELKKSNDENEQLAKDIEALAAKLKETEKQREALKKLAGSENKARLSLGLDVDNLEKKVASLEKKRGSKTDADIDELKLEVAALREAVAQQQMLAAKYKRYAVELKRELMKQQASSSASETAEVSTGSAPERSLGPLERGHTLLAIGSAAAALGAFQEALQDDEGSLDARIGLATAYFKLGKLAAASDVCQSILKEERDHPETLGLTGIIAFQKGDAKRAKSYLASAVKKEPKNAYLQAYLGIVEYSLGRMKTAREYLSNAVTLNPLDADSQYNLAVVYAELREPELELARRHYQRAVDLGAPPDLEFEASIR